MSNAAFRTRAGAVPDGTAAARRGLAGCVLALTFLLTQVPSIPELLRLAITAVDPSSASQTPTHQLDTLFSLVSGFVAEPSTGSVPLGLPAITKSLCAYISPTKSEPSSISRHTKTNLRLDHCCFKKTAAVGSDY